MGVDKVIPTIDGFEEEFKVPQGTQPGTVFNIPGQGRSAPELQPPRQYAYPGRRARAWLAEPPTTGTPGRTGPLFQRREASKTFLQRQKTLEEKANDEAASEPTPEELQEKGLFDRIKDAF